LSVSNEAVAGAGKLGEENSGEEAGAFQAKHVPLALLSAVIMLVVLTAVTGA
jgi:hypothetical protein